jgi:hypothetical protein
MANPEVAYEHTGTAAPTQLAAPVNDTDGTFTVVDGTGYPSGAGGDFFITLDGDNAAYERVLCSGRVGNVFTVAASGRGADGTVARDHSISAPVEHTWSAVEATQLATHVSSKKTVHGVSSDIVGIDDAQTMQNKTLITPTIASFLNAAHDHSNAAGGGAIPQASIVGLAASLAALQADINTRQLSSQKGAASGYASLDAGTKVPFAQIPSGTGASQVAVGNHDHAHTHSVGAPLLTAGLTAQSFADGDGVKTLASLVVPAGKYLLTADCKGITLGTATNTPFQYDLATSAGTLSATPIVTRESTTLLCGGRTIVGYLDAPAGATVTFTGEKLNNGALITNSTIGKLRAIPLSALAKD